MKTELVSALMVKYMVKNMVKYMVQYIDKYMVKYMVQYKYGNGFANQSKGWLISMMVRKAVAVIVFGPV